MSVLHVRNLSKAFGGVHAVENVSFDVGKGEFLALIGPNGAGKSTCFNMINGQIAPDHGDIKFAERSIVGLKPRDIWRLGVGRTFQVAATFGSMTVAENVQMALVSHHGEIFRFGAALATRHRNRALDLLEQVGMASSAARACKELAYGDVKRVELAIAPMRCSRRSAWRTRRTGRAGSSPTGTSSVSSLRLRSPTRRGSS